MKDSPKKARRGAKSSKRAGREEPIGTAMTWEREEDEQRMRERTHNAIRRRFPLIDMYRDFFTRHA